MLTDEEIEKLKGKKLCFHCVGEKYLSDEIQIRGKRGKCSYCSGTARQYGIGEMADRIEQVFDQHYYRTSDQPNSYQQTLLSDKESDYDWERDGEPAVYAIMNAADMPESAASDIQQILEKRFFDFDSAAAGEENEFSSQSYYEEKGTNDARWQEEWGGSSAL